MVMTVCVCIVDRLILHCILIVKITFIFIILNNYNNLFYLSGFSLCNFTLVILYNWWSILFGVSTFSFPYIISRTSPLFGDNTFRFYIHCMLSNMFFYSRVNIYHCTTLNRRYHHNFERYVAMVANIFASYQTYYKHMASLDVIRWLLVMALEKI